ncbi:MAG: acyl-CoA thioesterase [Microcoleaceae cyanobacterium]
MSHVRIIQFQDTDAAGVVYFSNLLSMCHEAYEASLAFSQINLRSFFSSSEFAIPIVHANIDFYQPIFCGDRIFIDLTRQQLTETEFEIHYRISNSENNQSLVAKAATKHVCISPSSRKRQPLPDMILQWLT